MYKLTLTNNYAYTVKAGKEEVAAGKTATLSEDLGNVIIDVPGLGSINLIDLGDKHIGGPSTATWGVLLSYQGNESIFRYEGEGKLTITLNDLGQAILDGNGEITLMRLESFQLKKEEKK